MTKVLTEAAAATDLAGLPRPVSEQRRVSLFTVYADAELRDSDNNVLAIFPAHRMDEARRVVACWNACEGVDTQLLASHPAPFSTLVSERDALASRVRGLEAALGDVIVDCTHLHHAKKDRHSFSDPCPVERRIRAALTTPESKP